MATPDRAEQIHELIKEYERLRIVASTRTIHNVKGKVTIDKGISSLHFQNITFENEVYIKGISKNFEINIQNCKFLNGLFIEDIGSEELTKYAKATTIQIKDSQIVNSMSIEVSILSGITISQTKIDDFAIRNTRLINGNIEISESEITQELLLYNLVIPHGDIYMYESMFHDCAMTRLQSKTLSIGTSTFNRPFNLLYVELYEDFYAHNSTFKDSVRLEAIKFFGTTAIRDNIFEKHFSIMAETESTEKIGLINKLSLINNKVSDQFVLDGFQQRLNILELEFSSLFTGNYLFNQSYIGILEFSGVNSLAIIRFSGDIFDVINFKEFQNYSNLTFSTGYSTDSIGELNVINSNMGKTQFYNFSFSSFGKINIFNSVLTDMIFASCTWFDDYRFNKSQEYLTFEKSRNSREVYRQLKVALEKNGDRIQSLHFKALELEYLKRELKECYGKSTLNRDFQILWVSQTNDFGLNWHKPLRYLIVGTIISYIFLSIIASSRIIFVPSLDIEDVKVTFKVLMENIEAFPLMFNPIRPTNNLFPNVGFWANLIDSLHRIVVSFFIFQIITAFRKYLK